MRTTATTMVLLAALGGPATAQTAPNGGTPPPIVTHLHLAAEGSVSAPPDLLVGDLSAAATSASAADAQHRVNVMVAQAMKDARAVDGIEARAMGYAVNRVDLDDGAKPDQPHPRRMGWTAQQTVQLRGKDGERVLSLVGKLQDEGLAVSGLDWQLSPELARQARDAAMVAALQALRARADKAAQALGLRVDHLQDVRVDVPEPSPIRPMMAMRLQARPAPEATPAPQDVTSAVSADIALVQ